MALSLLCTFVAHITFLHVFFLPPLSFSLSLLLSLSLSFSLSLFISAPLFLSVVARHMSSDALYQIFSSWSILLFHTISFHSSYKILQLFTDYLLRLPSSELLEKHLFRSRANRRLVFEENPRHMTGRYWIDSPAHTGFFYHFCLICAHNFDSSIHTGVGSGFGWSWCGVPITFMFTCTHRHCTLIMWGSGWCAVG